MNYAFFHTGVDQSLPRMLCNSIRLTQGSDVNIVHISDLLTEQVEGSSSIHRAPGLAPNSPMFSRMIAYRHYLSTAPGCTMFLDTDMLVVREIPAEQFGQFTVLCRRYFDRDSVVNNVVSTPAGPLAFPDHNGMNTLDQLYPFLGCFFVDSSTEYLDCALRHYEQLDTIYHQWFGDQLALKFASKQISVCSLSEAVVACLPDRIKEVDPSRVFILHYKGARRKAAMYNDFLSLKACLSP